MKKIDIHHKSKPRLLIYSIASALAFMSLEAFAAFAEIPLHLQNENQVEANKVKPQVMFLIDDSGSMRWVVGSDSEPRYSSEVSRMKVTKDALNAVLDKYRDNFKWGLHTLNDPSLNTRNGYITYQEMKNLISRLKTSGGTPTTKAYYETAKTVMDNTLYRCQKNYIVVMSDGDANLSYDFDRYGNVVPQLHPSRSNRTPPRQNILYDHNSRREVYKGSYIPNFVDDPYFGYKVGGIAQHKSRTTIGANGQSKRSDDTWDPVWDRESGLQWFSHTLATKDFKKKSDSNPTGKYQERHWDGHPDDPADYSKQIAETFTVGFGSSLSDAGREYLRKGASKPSYFFNAQNAESLVGSFNSIFENIADANIPIKTTGTVAPAVFGNRVPNLAAIVDVNTGSWSSRIKFFDVNSEGKLNTAHTKEPLFSERKTLINLGRPIGTSGGKEVYWADNIENGNNGMFNLPSTAPANEWREALIPWITRAQDDNVLSARAETSNFSQPYRIRPTGSAASADTHANDSDNQRNLGDILDTPILTIGDLVDNRQKYLVTAANDGMVHLFQAHNRQHPYSLKLSYIPAGTDREIGNTMGRLLKDVAHKDYGKKGQPHHYLINGGLVLRRTAPENNQSHSFLFGTLGQGGRGAYALNIGGHDRGTNRPTGIDSPVNDWINTVPLFETAKGVNNHLGYTVSTPQIGRVAVTRTKGKVNIRENVVYAGFLANGYSDEKGESQETALYVYNMLGQNAYNGQPIGVKGRLMKKIVIPNAMGGLSGPTLVDTDFDGVVDIAYAGDYRGNMYRFDLRGNPDTWKADLIYQGSTEQPITSAPAVSRMGKDKYVVIFGTGSELYQDDRDSKVQQAVYGIYDDVSQQPQEVKSDQLLQQILTVNGDLREVTNHPFNPQTHKGWKVNLGAGDGERVVVKPTMVLRSAFISTRIYHSQTTTTRSADGDLCLPTVTNSKTDSSSWVLALNAATGGKVSKADAHIKFIQKADDPNAIAAGMRYSGIINFNYVDGTRAGDYSVTPDGDSGGTGTDKPLNEGGSGAPKNHCFSKKGKRFILKTDQETLEVDGKVCNSVRRISWREIF
ncbi:VWA domain-containing protein [Neisseria sp. Dent CA1/247]|uniref:PilC family type IV pilus tip adhesin n=1 Tax=Neisseria sp. Dent CA1/247 TaxID=2912675 RepID=UPI001FD0771B|nr:PilC family type IV pilus tip adhesin [Neisseria sp. Dent CA1/247]UOO76888.1 VWA domain-containing protein [Neisseria sp. Dent CA1/247]